MRSMILIAAFTFLVNLGGIAAASWSPQPADPFDPDGLGRLARGDILLIGEVHGTRETPAAFLALVDRATAAHGIAGVGLEMPITAGAAGCDGGDAPLGAFWRRPVQDGRSSAAMRELVCDLKARAARGKVRLLYLGGAGIGDYPARTAARLGIEADAGRPILVLVGNFHARNTPGSIAAVLAGQGRKVTALTASARTAETWSCTAEGCGPRPMGMGFCQVEPTGPYLLTKAIRDSRWDGCLALPRATSSPPAFAAALGDTSKGKTKP
ncbi:MAG TPA: hypothetical protein VEZ70_02610 [Allosphingosinicella sp.]|nr:hypothetical protein [Allosphingosinicella sp.]